MNKLIERASDILKKQGVSKFDIYGLVSHGLNIEVKGRAIEKVKVPLKKGVAIRAIIDGKLGFAHTRDVSEEGIRIAIECAKENAKIADSDDYDLSMPAKSSLDFPLFDENYFEIPVSKKIDIVKALEEKVYFLDSRVKVVRKVAYSDSIDEISYHNSNGQKFHYKTSSFSLSVMLKAEEAGDNQMGWDFDVTRFFSSLNYDVVAARAVESATILLGAKPLKTVKIPVIFKNTVFAELMGTLSSGFLGNNVLRGKSIFADKLGFEVASHVLSVYDNPHLEDGIGSCPYDDEGTVTKRTAVIERGVLKNFLADIYSAKRLGLANTGNGMRSGIGSLPQSGISNMVVEQGAMSFESLMRTPEKVLVITDAMGIHTINPVSGEFSIGVSGVFVKDGEILQPVTGCTVAGNVKKLLNNITEVGRDGRWIGNISTPSILVKELMVGGL